MRFPPARATNSREPYRRAATPLNFPRRGAALACPALVPGLGTRKSVQIIERLHTPMAVFRASRSELVAQGLSGAIAQSVASGCTFDDAVQQQKRMTETGTTLIPLTSPLYPDRLREIYDPPLVLFARGRLELLDTLMLGVVGTRRPTPYGNGCDASGWRATWRAPG